MRWLSRLRQAVKHWPVIDQARRLRFRRLYGRMPFVINLELTTRCNAKCRMCPHPESGFEKKVMSLDSLDGLLDHLEGAVRPGTVIYPVGLGEPLLIPSLYEVNRRIAGRFPAAHIHFNTNGILLAHPRAGAFLEFTHQLVVSLNAHGADKYRALMRVDRYEEVVDGLRIFLARRARHPRFLELGFPRVVVQMMGLDAYADDFAEFQAAWKPRLDPRDAVHFIPMDNWGGSIPDNTLYRRKRSGRYPCVSLWRQVSIDIDGGVYPCCAPYGTRNGKSIELGNIFDRPLAEMLGQGRLGEIKRLHCAGKSDTLEACAGCDAYRVYPNIHFKLPLAERWV